MGLDYAETLFLTSPLHDIGKIGIPDQILLKQGRLSPEEFEIMKRHCEICYGILQQNYKEMNPFLEWRNMQQYLMCNNPLLETASVIAMTHHERWDGTGYPCGLKGNEIPMEYIVSFTPIKNLYEGAKFFRVVSTPPPLFTQIFRQQQLPVFCISVIGKN